jgi:hypothetical protein
MAWLLNVPQLQPVQELEALKDSGLVASTGATWHYREALVAPSSFKDPEYFKVRLLISILHNPNFGTLSDRIWRRMIEFILLGAENRREGVLPDIKDIAWRIRTTESDIDACLSTLAEKGLAEKNDTGCWTIKDFAIFRNSLSDVERKRQQREKEAAESAGSQDGTPESQAVADERPDGMRATRGPDDAFKPKSVAST